MISSNSILRTKELSGDLVIKKVSTGDVLSYDNATIIVKAALKKEIPSEYATLGITEQQRIETNIILNAVNSFQKGVEGYVTESGNTDTERLLKDLKEDIVGFKILTELLEDPNVEEIEINQWSRGGIWYVSSGSTHQFLINGQPAGFKNSQELDTVIKKLISFGPTPPEYNETEALITGRTFHGYRVAITDKSATAIELKDGFTASSNITIRKQKASRLTLNKIIGYKSLTSDMGKLLALAGRATLNVLFTGRTGSGKTAGLDIYCQFLGDKRIIAVQNPSEIILTKYDAQGNILNNVIHWEAKQDPKSGVIGEGYPNNRNLIKHTLRNTPEVVIVGESRYPKEFAEIMEVADSGHAVATTGHSKSAAEAIKRTAKLVAEGTGTTREFAIEDVASTFDLVIVHERLEDSSRKIIQISEIIADDAKGVIINDLFRFIPDGNISKEGSKVTNIGGNFYKTGSISDDLMTKLFMKGITRDELSFITEKMAKDEKKLDTTHKGLEDGD